MLSEKGTSAYAARVNECECRGHNIGAILITQGDEPLFLCSKCGETLGDIKGEENAASA